MKYFIKQSSTFIIVSIMLCLISITYQEKTNFNASLKTTATTAAKTEMKSEAKSTTALKTEMKSEAKATTAAKTEMKSEAKDKMAISAKTEMEALVETKAEFDASMAAESNTDTGLARGWVMIKGRGNLCIKYAGGRKHIRQGRCNRSRNVQWRFIRYGGRYIIQNRSGYVIDLYAYKKNNGAHIYAWNRKNGTNQRWSVQHIGGRRYLIRSQHSGKCLDNTGKARVNRHYHQWSCSRRNANQHFYIIPIRSKRRRSRRSRGGRTANMPKGWKMIRGRGNLCIRYAGRHRLIRQGRCNRSRNVQWRFLKYANRYIIQNRSGQVIDLYASKKNNGARIYAWSRKNGANQRWIFQSIGGGRYLIKSHHSKKCLDNTGKARVNRYYHQWSCSRRNANQHFYIRNVGRGRSTKLKTRKNKRRSRRSRRSRGGRKSRKSGKAPKWKKCANENGNCRCTGTIKFGARGKFNFKKSNGSLKCSNSLFKDPIRGVKKACYCKAGAKSGRKPKGKSGIKAPKGKSGKGPRGKSGKGPKGPKGKSVKGPRGKSGKGPKGPKGKSVKGPRGKSGKGPRGKSGKGPKGPKGKSVKGPRGKSGKGPKGPKGKSGKGPRGKSGKGPRGKSGKGKSGKGGKMRYRKKKTLKFMKGKYKFNLKTGKAFCASKCANNKASKEGDCFKNGVKKCKGCSFTGNKSTKKGKESQELCSIVCRSIKNGTCDFYAYIDDKKKVINKKLLNRFGRIFVMKFLQKMR